MLCNYHPDASHPQSRLWVLFFAMRFPSFTPLTFCQSPGNEYRRILADSMADKFPLLVVT